MEWLIREKEDLRVRNFSLTFQTSGVPVPGSFNVNGQLHIISDSDDVSHTTAVQNAQTYDSIERGVFKLLSVPFLAVGYSGCALYRSLAWVGDARCHILSVPIPKAIDPYLNMRNASDKGNAVGRIWDEAIRFYKDVIGLRRILLTFWICQVLSDRFSTVPT